MHADIKGALDQLDNSYKAFVHEGHRMTKSQVKRVLEYGISKGYKSTSEFSDDEIEDTIILDDILNNELTLDPNYNDVYKDGKFFFGFSISKTISEKHQRGYAMAYVKLINEMIKKLK